MILHTRRMVPVDRLVRCSLPYTFSSFLFPCPLPPPLFSVNTEQPHLLHMRTSVYLQPCVPTSVRRIRQCTPSYLPTLPHSALIYKALPTCKRKLRHYSNSHDALFPRIGWDSHWFFCSFQNTWAHDLRCCSSGNPSCRRRTCPRSGT